MNTLSGNTRRIVRIVGILSMCVMFLSVQAYAQVGLPGIETAVLITYEPAHPGSGDTVRLKAQSSVLDLEKANVVWRANGKKIAEGAGVDSTSTTVGALGTATEIEVSVAAQDEIVASALVTIVPTELDLLVDSDAYAPPFYRGRAPASAGTNLRLQAIPLFKQPGGPYVTNTNIDFTWRKNGEVIGSASGRGKSSAIIPVQHLFGTDRISVEARSIGGLLVNETSFVFSPAQPILTLYQNHPLLGILYHQALGTATFIPDSEMTFVAVPYFAQAERAEDAALTYAWRVNGRTIPSETNQNSITINAENSRGVALLNLELTHATNYYLDAKGSWNITFSADSSTLDQFRSIDQEI